MSAALIRTVVSSTAIMVECATGGGEQCDNTGEKNNQFHNQISPFQERRSRQRDRPWGHTRSNLFKLEEEGPAIHLVNFHSIKAGGKTEAIRVIEDVRSPRGHLGLEQGPVEQVGREFQSVVSARLKRHIQAEQAIG